MPDWPVPAPMLTEKWLSIRTIDAPFFQRDRR